MNTKIDKIKEFYNHCQLTVEDIKLLTSGKIICSCITINVPSEFEPEHLIKIVSVDILNKEYGENAAFYIDNELAQVKAFLTSYINASEKRYQVWDKQIDTPWINTLSINEKSKLIGQITTISSKLPIDTYIPELLEELGFVLSYNADWFLQYDKEDMEIAITMDGISIKVGNCVNHFGDIFNTQGILIYLVAVNVIDSNIISSLKMFNDGKDGSPSSPRDNSDMRGGNTGSFFIKKRKNMVLDLGTGTKQALQAKA
jgi:hypothetical protein